jgi:O-antigen/teichoic acid export membrane protein
MLPYAKHLTLSGVGFLFFGQIDKFILYHFFGPVSLASYWIASSIPQEFGRVVSTIGQVAFPKFVDIDHEKSKPLIKKRFLMSILVLFAISLVYACVAYPFFFVFFHDYLAEVPKSIFLMFGLAIIPYYFIWGYYTAKAKHVIVYGMNIVDPTLQVILYLACIPFFGVWGLVLAVCLKTILMNILAWYILKKY